MEWAFLKPNWYLGMAFPIIIKNKYEVWKYTSECVGLLSTLTTKCHETHQYNIILAPDERRPLCKSIMILLWKLFKHVSNGFMLLAQGRFLLLVMSILRVHQNLRALHLNFHTRDCCVNRACINWFTSVMRDELKALISVTKLFNWWVMSLFVETSKYNGEGKCV